MQRLVLGYISLALGVSVIGCDDEWELPTPEPIASTTSLVGSLVLLDDMLYASTISGMFAVPRSGGEPVMVSASPLGEKLQGAADALFGGSTDLLRLSLSDGATTA